MGKWFVSLVAGLFALCAGPAAAVQIVITSGTTWAVPADWNNLANTIEVVGAGGVGGGPSYSGSYYGGGGGAYSKKNNVFLPAGGTVSIAFEGPNCDTLNRGTWVSSKATVFAQSGRCGAQPTPFFSPGSGGDASAGVGDVKYSGGNGTISGGGPGSGGGAAGRFGAGISGNMGGAGDAGFGGAGGTGANPGSPGTEFGGGLGSGGGGGDTGNGGAYGGGSGSLSGTPGAGLIIINYQPYRRTAAGMF